MNYVIVIVAALVLAVVHIDAVCTGNCCFPSPHCVGVTKSCANDANNVYSCKNSFRSSADSGCTCQPYVGFNGACDATIGGQCVDTTNHYSLGCSNSKCLYIGGAVAPGETCPSDQSGYASGNACILGTTKCSDAAVCGNVSTATGNCNEAGLYCPHGSYCVAGANATAQRVCAARLQSGGKCGSTIPSLVSYECDWDLYCSGGSCIAPFSVGTDGSCNSVVDCTPGLACIGSKCVKPSNGKSCSVSAQDCDTGYGCGCKSLSSGDSGKCAASTVPKSSADKVKALLSCLKTSGCTADFPWSIAAGAGLPVTFFQHASLQATNTPDACFVQKCKSQVSDLFSLAGNGCGTSSPANTIAVASFVVFALLAFLFMF